MESANLKQFPTKIILNELFWLLLLLQEGIKYYFFNRRKEKSFTAVTRRTYYVRQLGSAYKIILLITKRNRQQGCKSFL